MVVPNFLRLTNERKNCPFFFFFFFFGGGGGVGIFFFFFFFFCCFFFFFFFFFLWGVVGSGIHVFSLFFLDDNFIDLKF